jgi:hypothetical protein
VYGSWGTTAVVRGDEWARTGRVSGSAGSAAAVRTSSGGSAVVVRGQNDVYAARDGQVYRRTDSGWAPYDGGGGSSAASRVDAATAQSLDRDAAMRASGASQASQAQAWRSSGGGGGSRAGAAPRGGGGGGRGGRR